MNQQKVGRPVQGERENMKGKHENALMKQLLSHQLRMRETSTPTGRSLIIRNDLYDCSFVF